MSEQGEATKAGIKRGIDRYEQLRKLDPELADQIPLIGTPSEAEADKAYFAAFDRLAKMAEDDGPSARPKPGPRQKPPGTNTPS